MYANVDRVSPVLYAHGVGGGRGGILPHLLDLGIGFAYLLDALFHLGLPAFLVFLALQHAELLLGFLQLLAEVGHLALMLFQLRLQLPGVFAHWDQAADLAVSVSLASAVQGSRASKHTSQGVVIFGRDGVGLVIVATRAGYAKT